MATGTVVKVSGPLVVAEGLQDANMYDVVRVGPQRLIGEVIEMRITFIVSGADHADARRRECIKVTHLLLERCVCLFQRLRCVDDRLQVHAVIAIGDLRAAQCLQNMHKLRD